MTAKPEYQSPISGQQEVSCISCERPTKHIVDKQGKETLHTCDNKINFKILCKEQKVKPKNWNRTMAVMLQHVASSVNGVIQSNTAFQVYDYLLITLSCYSSLHAAGIQLPISPRSTRGRD